jgi:DNA-binding NtrC family response regulator
VREVINVAQRAAMLADKPEVCTLDLGLPAATRLKAAPLATAAPVAHVPAAPAPAPTPPPPPAAPYPEEHAGHNGAGRNGVGGHLVFNFDHGPHKAEEVEKELIIQALRKTHGNVSKAAKLIGMQRSSFRYRIDRYALHGLVQEIANR